MFEQQFTEAHKHSFSHTTIQLQWTYGVPLWRPKPLKNLRVHLA
jgi:hypothetical protein